jgi:histidine triad (HIT) family protein
MSCLFCAIIKGDVVASKVYEDEHCVAFLDHRPLFPGHCLVVPKKHLETLTDLPDEMVGSFFLDVKLLARAVEDALEAEGSFVAMNNRVSQSVPHLHVHIVPRRKKDGLKGFFWPRNKYHDEANMTAIQKQIKNSVARIQKQL